MIVTTKSDTTSDGKKTLRLAGASVTDIPLTVASDLITARQRFCYGIATARDMTLLTQYGLQN